MFDTINCEQINACFSSRWQGLSPGVHTMGWLPSFCDFLSQTTSVLNPGPPWWGSSHVYDSFLGIYLTSWVATERKNHFSKKKSNVQSYNSPHMKTSFTGHLGDSFGWMSNSWFQLKKSCDLRVTSGSQLMGNLLLFLSFSSCPSDPPPACACSLSLSLSLHLK